MVSQWRYHDEYWLKLSGGNLERSTSKAAATGINISSNGNDINSMA